MGSRFPDRNEEFDRLLPVSWRPKSEVHFTPVDVARRAAELVVPHPTARVLDVGAAVGKFCLVAGAAHPRAEFVGIEQRAHLVEVARELARRLTVPNVSFVHGDATELDWSRYDAFYFFNPFAEHLQRVILDDTIELDRGYFVFYVDFVRQRLAEARIGTRVVTYHGFGAAPPAGYALVVDEPAGSDRLLLWVKTEEVDPVHRIRDVCS